MYFDRNPNGGECIRSIGIMGTSKIYYTLSECDYSQSSSRSGTY